MKRIFIILAALSVLAGCKKEKIAGEEGTGTLAVTVSNDGTDYSDKVVSSKASASGVDVSKFKVRIDSKSGGGVSYSWDSYSEMPSMLELPSGEYIVVANSPDENTVSWNKPVYGGSKDFSIAVGAVSNVDLTCSLVNMKISINASDAFRKELSEYEVTVKNQYGTLIWTKADVEQQEEKSGYFPVAPLEVFVSGKRSIDGAVATYYTKIENVAARDHHILNLNAVTTGNVGSLEINVDDSLNDREENIDVPGFEEIPVPGGDPSEPEEPETPAFSMDWPANPDFAPVEIKDVMDVKISITAKNGIKTFVVKVNSEALNAIITELDLVNPGDMKEIVDMILQGQNILGATSVSLDLSSLVPLIAQVGAEPDSDHIFTLEMSDNAGNSFGKTVTFHYSGNLQ